ncbi:hypothetical protein GVAV_000393 [Gurleya vavrai]
MFVIFFFTIITCTVRNKKLVREIEQINSDIKNLEGDRRRFGPLIQATGKEFNDFYEQNKSKLNEKTFDISRKKYEKIINEGMKNFKHINTNLEKKRKELEYKTT